MSFHRFLSLIAWLLCVALSAGRGISQDWPSIRGPQHDGSSTTSDRSIATGPLNMKVVWKHDFGSGYSGIVKSGDRLVSAMADVPNDQEFIVAMSAETGEVLWKTRTGKMMKGANGSFDGPVATPAVDSKHAYHLSPFGDLAAYSLTDGSIVWSHNLAQDFSSEPNFYGFGASPILHDGVLVLVAGSPEGAVIGFDTASGDVRWKAGTDGAAFQTPVPFQIAGSTALIAAGNTNLYAIRPGDGEVIWSQPHGGAESQSTFSIIPVALGGDGLFLADQRDGSTVLDLSDEGAAERWSGRDIRNSYCVPVMAGDLLCSYSSRFLVAVDPESGERIWRTRKPGDGFLATIDGRLLVSTINGTLHVGDVNEDGFEEAASTSVFETKGEASDGLVWSLPAVSGRSVFLRSLHSVARVDIEPGPRSTEVATDQSDVSDRFSMFLSALNHADDKTAFLDQYLKNASSPLIDGDHVHFFTRGDFKDVAVASEIFGVRQERAMIRVDGTDFFYFGVKLPGSARVSYVYFADFQPMVDPMNERQVASTTLMGEMEPTFMGPGETLTLSWFDKGTVAGDLTNAADHPTGELEGRLETIELKSKNMGETIPLSVYLPPGYDDSKQSYPAVFVHDGQVALESGNQAAVVDELIQSEKIRPTIAVFIHRRFYPMQGANGYPEMFGGELLPKIIKEYRVSEDRNDRASMSGGFGATLALMSTLPSSGLVGRIGCHSPFAFEMIHPVVAQLSNLPNERCRIFVQWSKYDLHNPSENWDMAHQSQVIAEFLRDGGHDVSSGSVPMGSDWTCWRTQSSEMWKFLVGSGA
ncbi:MAG: PQQ-binding-like beta-propeller repeat protein [Planctomycetota bacterium]